MAIFAWMKDRQRLGLFEESQDKCGFWPSDNGFQRKARIVSITLSPAACTKVDPGQLGARAAIRAVVRVQKIRLPIDLNLD